jgi:hypothetical protein
VVEGMALLSARPRGTEALGFYKEPAQNIPIVRARLAADLPAAERPAYQVLRSDSQAFTDFCHGPRQSRRRILPAPRGRGRHLQCPGAGAENRGITVGRHPGESRNLAETRRDFSSWDPGLRGMTCKRGQHGGCPPLPRQLTRRPLA